MLKLLHVHEKLLYTLLSMKLSNRLVYFVYNLFRYGREIEIRCI